MRRLLMLILAITPWLLPAAQAAQSTADESTYDQDTMVREAASFFGKGAEGIADVIKKAFADQGRPNGYIKGEEASGAIGIGVRYGHGTLVMKSGARRAVYWQGPSVGFDFGANAAKVFVLVYNLPRADRIFQRFPGVDGSLYFVAGVGINYLRSEGTVLAPIRLGVGWRQGANVGYMHVTRKKSWVPF